MGHRVKMITVASFVENSRN